MFACPGWLALAEYRLDELARISGVSARNIRAYRERGLLDPPRRVGRSAFYDDYHLSQLRTINQLHRRGFNSAHIAEFFTSMRQGADLADILGIQRAVLGPRSDEPPDADPPESGRAPAAPRALDVDPEGAEARKLIEYGLAQRTEGGLMLSDTALAAIVARASDKGLYLRALLQIYEATGDALEGLAGGFARSLQESAPAGFGGDHALTAEELTELEHLVSDYRDLCSRIVSVRLDDALQQHLLRGQPDATAT